MLYYTHKTFISTFLIFIAVCLKFSEAKKSSLQKSPSFHSTSISQIYSLVFEYGYIAPDNYIQRAILTNGQFPGPTLHASQHDTLIVEVTNKLDHEFTIHFHGILQKGTVSSDGVEDITQYAIQPNSTYHYRMEIGSQSGTFIYHSHSKMDQIWALGLLIINEDRDSFGNELVKYAYDYEESFLLSQLWHVSTDSISDGVTGAPFEDVPDTVSLLINGRSYREWEEGNGDAKGYSVIRVKLNAIYRFRVAALGADSMLTFQIENHTQFEIIEMDGILVNKVETDHLELNSAQRYSILIKMDQPIGNYWIQTKMLTGPGPDNGRAILHYEGAPDPSSSRKTVFKGETEELELGEWVQSKLYPNQLIYQPEVYPVPTYVDREIVITSHQVNVGEYTKFNINGKIVEHFSPPLLHQIRAGLNITDSFTPSVFEILEGESVQIVFENLFSDDSECEQHPWHLHGHTFHIVGEGANEYNSIRDSALINENIAKNENQFRDVLTLFPNRTDGRNETGLPCGWIAVRFIADNPGLWLVHCHITAHMLMGKKFTLYEHSQIDPYLGLIS